MDLPLSRRDVLVALAMALGGCGADGETGSTGTEAQTSTRDGTAEVSGSRLTRLALTSIGAEVTGLFLGPQDSLFMNVQHPSISSNEYPFRRAAVGAFVRPLGNLPEQFESVQTHEEPTRRVDTSWGEYQILAYGGQDIGDGEKLGIVTDPSGRELTRARNPDFNAFVPLSQDEGYLFTNWESKPGMISRLHISRSAPGSRWWVDDAENLDLRDVEGSWRNCFGTLSPWGTPLSSEELNYPDTSRWNSPTPGLGVPLLREYLGHYPNPYRYGYIVEIQDPKAKSPTPVKQTALGRFSHENALVMPDRRTVYMSDDGHGTGFYKFVADEAGDLSAGTLSAAKARQDRGRDPTSVGFELEWIELAHGTRSQIESWIAEYDGITPDDWQEEGTSYISDAEIEAWARGEAADDRAAFLETRRAAEAAGATIEFNKMEGINARPGAEPGDDIFMAMSGIKTTMADEEGDVQLTPNAYGAVYRLPIEEGYDVQRMEPLIVGGPDGNVCGGCPYDATPDSSDVCENCTYNPENETSTLGSLDVENTIASPDNLVVMNDGRLIVGEDSTLHDNSMVWVYNN